LGKDGMLWQSEARNYMQLITKVPAKARLGKGELTISLTPTIIEWCDRMAEQERVYRIRFIEETILSLYQNQRIFAELKALSGGSIQKSNHLRWGELKRAVKLRIFPETIKILEDLSKEVAVSKSECVEYMLRSASGF
jgi:hypothetical protein